MRVWDSVQPKDLNFARANCLVGRTWVGLRVCPLKPVSLWRTADSHNAPQPPRWHRAVWERQLRQEALGWRLGSSLDSQAVLAHGALLGCGQAAYDAVSRGLSLRPLGQTHRQQCMCKSRLGCGDTRRPERVGSACSWETILTTGKEAPDERRCL